MKRKQRIGSNKTTRITQEQFIYMLDELQDKNDFRMIALISLLYRCVRIGDAIETLTIADLYEEDGTIKSEIHYKEQKTHKERILNISGSRFIEALREYYPTLCNKQRERKLFYQQKNKSVPLSASGVKSILAKFVGKRGIEQCSPHSLRKGEARAMHDNGGIN